MFITLVHRHAFGSTDLYSGRAVAPPTGLQLNHEKYTLLDLLGDSDLAYWKGPGTGIFQKSLSLF